MNNVCSRLSSRVNLLRMTYGISDSDSVCSCALYTHTIINLMDMKCVTMSTTFVYSERMAKRDFIRSKFTYDNYYLREVTVETMASIQSKASNRWRWQQRWRARREKRYSPLSAWQSFHSLGRWLILFYYVLFTLYIYLYLSCVSCELRRCATIICHNLEK